MPCILLVAHAPLATSLLTVARHVYADCGRDVAAVDVPASASLNQAEAQIAQALQGLPAGDVLVLVDAFGATPCNAALNLADGVHTRVVAGLNVPMLWRTLCYAALPLADLVTRAVDGGRLGIMQVAAPRRQNQPHRAASDDSESNPNQ